MAQTSEKIIEFPFRMNWIAAVKGGEFILELYWDVLQTMNNFAIDNEPMNAASIDNVNYFNDLFVKWDLPVFKITDPDTPGLPFPEQADKVITFPGNWYHFHEFLFMSSDWGP